MYIYSYPNHRNSVQYEASHSQHIGQFYIISTFWKVLWQVVDKLLALAVEFIWSPAKKQMISKQRFYLDDCRGRWDLLRFPSKTDSLFFANNLVRCVDERFKHPCIGFFKYFFAVRNRDLFPKCYDNASPHSLLVKKPCSYFGLIGLYRDLSDKLEVIFHLLFHRHISYTSGYLRMQTSQRGFSSNTLLGWEKKSRIQFGSRFRASI